MADGEDWLMRPWLHGKCSYEGLKDGTYDLFDIALMNEAIDVDEINKILIARASK